MIMRLRDFEVRYELCIYRGSVFENILELDKGQDNIDQTTFVHGESSTNFSPNLCTVLFLALILAYI